VILSVRSILNEGMENLGASRTRREERTHSYMIRRASAPAVTAMRSHVWVDCSHRESERVGVRVRRTVGVVIGEEIRHAGTLA
jgi:hypothetical protein